MLIPPANRYQTPESNLTSSTLSRLRDIARRRLRASLGCQSENGLENRTQTHAPDAHTPSYGERAPG